MKKIVATLLFCIGMICLNSECFAYNFEFRIVNECQLKIRVFDNSADRFCFHVGQMVYFMTNTMLGASLEYTGCNNIVTLTNVSNTPVNFHEIIDNIRKDFDILNRELIIIDNRGTALGNSQCEAIHKKYLLDMERFSGIDGSNLSIKYK